MKSGNLEPASSSQTVEVITNVGNYKDKPQDMYLVLGQVQAGVNFLIREGMIREIWIRYTTFALGGLSRGMHTVW